MADIRATKNGNWSDTTVWNTGSLPTSADVVRPNNFTVTIDVNVSVTEIRNDAGGGAVVGGSFTLNDGVTVTASGGFFGTAVATTPQLLLFSSTGTVTLNGKLNGALVINLVAFCLTNSSTGTVVINGDVENTGNQNAAAIQNTSTGTVTINGNLIGSRSIINATSNGLITINGNLTCNGSGFITNTSGTVTVTGNVTSNFGGICITNISGVINVNGNLTINAGSTTGSFGRCIVNSGNGVINVIGDLFTDTNGNNQGHRNIVNSSTGIVNIIGNINYNGANGNQTGRSIDNAAGGTINVTGVVNGITVPSVAASILIVGTIYNETGTINITGTVNSGVFINTSQTFSTIFNNNGVVNINGNVQGGTGLACLNQSGGTYIINGNIVGGTTVVTVLNKVTGTINLNGNAIGGTSWFAIDGVSSAGNTIIERAVYSNLGQSPITGYIKFKTTNPEIDVLRTDNVIVTLRDPLNVSGLLPATSDVRSGTTYNAGSSTGTLAMPAPNLVQLGVPVDNTVGTGNLTPADFWNYLISNGFATGSIGQRLQNTSTVDTTGAQIAAFSS